jgi:hypothetical protein
MHNGQSPTKKDSTMIFNNVVRISVGGEARFYSTVFKTFSFRRSLYLLPSPLDILWVLAGSMMDGWGLLLLWRAWVKVQLSLLFLLKQQIDHGQLFA